MYTYYPRTGTPDLAVQVVSFQVLLHGFYLTLLMLNTSCPVLANSVDPDQLASEEATDLDLHCLSLNTGISIKSTDQVI